jgi:hypothetical protein
VAWPVWVHRSRFIYIIIMYSPILSLCRMSGEFEARKPWRMGPWWRVVAPRWWGLALVLALAVLGVWLWSRAHATESEGGLDAATRAALGRGTWNFLHRVAVKYPKQPTDKDKADIADFFRLLGRFYPCEECAAHFREMLGQYPPDDHTGNNQALSVWLCKLHNIVNARLNKPQFSCTLESLKEAYGACGCFDSPVNTTLHTTTTASPSA